MTILFQDGDNQGPNPGYTYSEMINNNSLFRYLQIDRSIPNGLDTLKISPTKITFYIDSMVSAYTNCYECAQFNVGGNYRTLHKFVIDGANLALFLQTDVSINRYLFSFSCLDTANEFLDTTALSVYNDTLYAFHSFNTNQRYRIKVDYDECGYFRTLGTDLNSATKKLEISNLAFFCGSLKGFNNQLQEPQNLNELHAHGWTISQPPNLNIINQLFADSFTFWCEGTGAFHYAFSSDFGLWGSRVNNGACGLWNSFTAVSMRANGLKDIYPFEYRPPVLFFNEYRYKIPAHFNFGSLTLQTYISRKPGWACIGYPPLSLSIPTIDADTFTTILESSLPPFQCATQSDSANFCNNTAWAGDLTIGRAFSYFLNIDTCTIGVPSPPPNDYQIILDTLILHCLNVGKCNVGNIF
jgi:hypothetical protein